MISIKGLKIDDKMMRVTMVPGTKLHSGGFDQGYGHAA